MKEQLIHILDKSVCLSRRQIAAYIAGTMEPEEIHAVEVHLNSCPLCSMAMDGYLEHKAEGTAALETLNSDFLKQHFDKALPQIHLNSLAPAVQVNTEKSGRKSIPIPWWRITGIAAALLIGAGAFWYVDRNDFTGKHQQDIAQAEPITTASEDQPQKESQGALSGAIEQSDKTNESAVDEISSNKSAEQPVGAEVKRKPTTTTKMEDSRLDNTRNVEDASAATPMAPAPVARDAAYGNSYEKEEGFKKEEIATNAKDAKSKKTTSAASRTQTHAEPVVKAEETRADAADRHQKMMDDAKKEMDKGNTEKARKLLQKIVDDRGPKWREARRMLRSLDDKK